MNRRALLVASVLALVSVTLLLLYMRKFEREKSGGEHIQLLVAVKPIERGDIITDAMLSTRDVPLAYVESRAIKAREKSKVIGLPAAVSLTSSQTLMWTDLAIQTENRELSSLVQPGKRALTVVAGGSSDTNGNALIRPGDYVDVISTMIDDKSGIETSVILLQRVLVLAVGTDTETLMKTTTKKTNVRQSHDKALTLSLNLREVQLLALAMTRSRISVAVRPPDEQTVVDDIPDMKASALLDTKERASVQRPTAHVNQPVRIDAVP